VEQYAPGTSGPNLRRIFVGIILALLVGAIVFAVRGGVPFGSGGTTGNLTPDLQALIQQANVAQAQAIGSKDPSVMAANATQDYYQHLIQTNHALLSSGVTSIGLVQIEWGSTTVHDQTATVENWETWSTDFNDWTTEIARDRNVYTLVLSAGAWKIRADAHPDTATSPGTRVGPRRATPQPTLPSVTVTPTTDSGSRNWAGYAATGGAFTSVSGVWNVPAFEPASAVGTDAVWVGIGGVQTTDLIQAGTQQMASGGGCTLYQAWLEMLPQPSRSVPVWVHGGDQIAVSISQQSTATWLISFTNRTTGQTYQIRVRYASSLSSAEWVVEAPSSARGRLLSVLPLDDFGSVAFSEATATRDGQTQTIAQAAGSAIDMISRAGQILADASALGEDGASFSVSRTASSLFDVLRSP
jgi:hypothetical protein